MSESAQSKEERRLAAECKGNKNSFKKEKKKKGKKGSLNRILKFAWQQHNPWSQCILTDTRRYLLEKHRWI